MHPQPVLVDRFDDLSIHERKNVAAMLHELFVTTRDAAAGYETAAKSVQDPALAHLLRGCAAERTEAAAELAGLLAALGDDRHDLPSVGGELHRGWIALRAALTHGEPAGVIAECERGEHMAQLRYDRALAHKLPMNIANVLLDQAQSVREARTAFERMRHPW
jgi:uncharacterized protein (TIGR02284 family)